MSENVSQWRKVAQFLGLAYAPDGQPSGRRGASRYTAGFAVSPRLDEDIDALRARLEDLERRLQ